MMELEESRKALMLGVERFALAARYFAYIILAAVFFMGGVEGALSDFIVVTLVVLVHNAFAHWVIFTDKTGTLTENRMALIFCNPNQSLIIDDHGELKQTGGKDEIVYHTFELNSERNQNHLTNRRPGTYSEIIQPK